MKQILFAFVFSLVSISAIAQDKNLLGFQMDKFYSMASINSKMESFGQFNDSLSGETDDGTYYIFDHVYYDNEYFSQVGFLIHKDNFTLIQVYKELVENDSLTNSTILQRHERWLYETKQDEQQHNYIATSFSQTDENGNVHLWFIYESYIHIQEMKNKAEH